LFDALQSGASATFAARQRQQAVAWACSESARRPRRWNFQRLRRHDMKRGAVASACRSDVALWLKEHALKA
jgi:hypothetical protein